MTHMTAGQLRTDMTSALERVVRRRDRIVLRRNKKDIAALVPIEDLRTLERLEDIEDLGDAYAILEEVKREGTVPWEKVKKNLGL